MATQGSGIERLRKIFLGYKVLNEAICRSTLITILSETADKVSESSRKLLDQEELKKRIDDLIHNSHMIAVH